MQTVCVGVLRGGTDSVDYQKSMSAGSILLRALREHDEYNPADILIDKNGVWHLDGVPVKPHQLINKIDLCIVTLEKPLENIGYVESVVRSLGINCVHNPKSALRGYIPESLRNAIESVGVRMARSLEVENPDIDFLKNIHNTFSPPYSLNFVNRLGEVSHIFHASNLNDVVDVFDNYQKKEEGNYIIEEYTAGDEWAVTIIPEFRGVKYYTLHPIYIGTTNPAFKSNLPKNRSAQDGFASPVVRESLDLYSKLAAAVMPTNIVTTFIFRHLENKKPVLLRAIEQYMLNDSDILLKAMNESAVSESEFLDIILNRYK
jgi:D-alanine-D-alanine ligase-like ATP-grasp enzyme